MNKKKSKIKIRTLVQAFFFILIALISVNHGLAETGNAIPLLGAASLHAICPFGGVVTFYEFITTGKLVQKIHESSLVIMGISAFLAILFGPVICGWVCPLGSIQDLFNSFGKKIYKKKFNNFVPEALDKKLRYLRYVVLIAVVVATAVSAKLLFSNIDPYYALFNFWSGEVAISSIAILLLTLGASLFVARPWCKYLCPFGALIGLSNKIKIFKIKRNNSTCISCGACDRVCPMNIKVSEKDTVRDTQCISCLECTSENSCPVKNTVSLTNSSKEEEFA